MYRATPTTCFWRIFCTSDSLNSDVLLLSKVRNSANSASFHSLSQSDGRDRSGKWPRSGKRPNLASFAPWLFTRLHVISLSQSDVLKRPWLLVGEALLIDLWILDFSHQVLEWDVLQRVLNLFLNFFPPKIQTLCHHCQFLSLLACRQHQITMSGNTGRKVDIWKRLYSGCLRKTMTAVLNSFL